MHADLATPTAAIMRDDFKRCRQKLSANDAPGSLNAAYPASPICSLYTRFRQWHM